MELHDSRLDSPPGQSLKCRGFTLIELLVSMSVLAILMLIVTSVISQTQKTMSGAISRASQFREARMAFDIITRNLSQATLNAYWDYDRDPGSPVLTTTPTRYERKSELQFITGPAKTLVPGGSAIENPTQSVFFQAPLGLVQNGQNYRLNNLLCGRGYYIQFGTDAAYIPSFASRYARPRYRLMEYSPPAERNHVYDTTVPTWYQDAGAPISATETATTRSASRPIAENIVALIISPRVSVQDSSGTTDPTWIAPDYAYNSRQMLHANSLTTIQGTQNLLPPLVQVTLVAIDEPSAEKLESGSAGACPDLVGKSGATFASAVDSAYQTDIKTLESYLISRKLNYRVFKTTVALRAARWSL